MDVFLPGVGSLSSGAAAALSLLCERLCSARREAFPNRRPHPGWRHCRFGLGLTPADELPDATGVVEEPEAEGADLLPHKLPTKFPNKPLSRVDARFGLSSSTFDLLLFWQSLTLTLGSSFIISATCLAVSVISMPPILIRVEIADMSTGSGAAP